MTEATVTLTLREYEKLKDLEKKVYENKVIVVRNSFGIIYHIDESVFKEETEYQIKGLEQDVARFRELYNQSLNKIHKKWWNIF